MTLRFANYLPLLVLLLIISCERDFSPLKIKEPDPRFHLSLRQAGATEMWLTLTLDSSNLGDEFEIMRDQLIIFKDTVNVKDTLVYDRFLQPLRSYTYYAYHIKEDKRIATVTFTVTFTVKTLDTTSHHIDWEIDTIGTFQSFLTDVWGTDENNVYAVGIIRRSSYPTVTNIIHWNGVEWEAIDFLEGDLNSIYGFGPDDIWVVGDGGGQQALIAHWDGSVWNTLELQQYERLIAVWGTSNSNLYAVGWNGTILHYDGNNWTKMESGTEKPLYDVWGVSSSNVYVVGYDPSTSRGIMLSLIENGWETVIETDTHPSSQRPHGDLQSVWALDKDNIYVTGTTTFQLILGKWEKTYLPVDLTALYKIRGNNMANIFIIGGFGLIIHYSGLNWRLVEDYHQTYGPILRGVWSFGEKTFIVGYTGDGSARGIVLRGNH